MSADKYSNFVRPSSPYGYKYYPLHPTLKGEEAKKLYLKVVGDVSNPEPTIYNEHNVGSSVKRSSRARSKVSDIVLSLTDKDLFLSAQNNDVVILKHILDNSPDKINLLDDYGWSLLMIACQACSIDVAKELLYRNIDTNIRDKAGNSARSLVIKNKNIALIDLLLTNKKTKHKDTEKELKCKKKKLKDFHCSTCNGTFSDEEEHLSSTIHNINASKHRKIPANYVIPASNKGYQLMLKGGWDRNSGLGPEGSGKRYPIKTVQKKDRKGLGHEKKAEAPTQEELWLKQNKKTIDRDRRKNRHMEISFRREFY